MDNHLFITLSLIAAVLITALLVWWLRYRRTTTQARRLRAALRRLGVESRLEYWDGHKHVDLFLPESGLGIEVDGLQHYLDPQQLLSDIRRACASCRSDAPTVHIPNLVVDRHLNELAQALASAARRL